MKYFFLIVIILWTCPDRSYTQDLDGLTGPAYAAAKAKQLKKLQAKNAAARPAPAAPAAPAAAPVKPPQLTGPAYAAARARWLYNIQARNARNYRTAPVGPAYAWQMANIKANQRFANGTWPNNTYFFRPYRTPKTYLNTPAFRPLSDPWMWYGQQPWGWWQWRY